MQVYSARGPVVILVQSAFFPLLPYLPSHFSVFSIFTIVQMRLTLPILGLAVFAIMVSAQAEVMRNITIHSNTEWIKKLANRTQGCTKENVGVRREWLVYITR